MLELAAFWKKGCNFKSTTFFLGGECDRLNLFCFLHPLHRLGLVIMKLPASCLNDGFLRKGYFTDSQMSLVLVYHSAEPPIVTTSE